MALQQCPSHPHSSPTCRSHGGTAGPACRGSSCCPAMTPTALLPAACSARRRLWCGAATAAWSTCQVKETYGSEGALCCHDSPSGAAPAPYSLCPRITPVPSLCTLCPPCPIPLHPRTTTSPPHARSPPVLPPSLSALYPGATSAPANLHARATCPQPALKGHFSPSPLHPGVTPAPLPLGEWVEGGRQKHVRLPPP